METKSLSLKIDTGTLTRNSSEDNMGLRLCIFYKSDVGQNEVIL